MDRANMIDWWITDNASTYSRSKGGTIHFQYNQRRMALVNKSQGRGEESISFIAYVEMISMHCFQIPAEQWMG
jgi:hypothetical protein